MLNFRCTNANSCNFNNLKANFYAKMYLIIPVVPISRFQTHRSKCGTGPGCAAVMMPNKLKRQPLRAALVSNQTLILNYRGIAPD